MDSQLGIVRQGFPLYGRYGKAHGPILGDEGFSRGMGEYGRGMEKALAAQVARLSSRPSYTAAVDPLATMSTGSSGWRAGPSKPSRRDSSMSQARRARSGTGWRITDRGGVSSSPQTGSSKEMIETSRGQASLPVGIAGLNSEQTPEYGMVMAAAILSCVPIVTVFFLMQRQIIAGLTDGAVKS
jgi:hypothetical protein